MLGAYHNQEIIRKFLEFSARALWPTIVHHSVLFTLHLRSFPTCVNSPGHRELTAFVTYQQLLQEALLGQQRNEEALLWAQGGRAPALSMLLGPSTPPLRRWEDLQETVRGERCAIPRNLALSQSGSGSPIW